MDERGQTDADAGRQTFPTAADYRAQLRAYVGDKRFKHGFHRNVRYRPRHWVRNCAQVVRSGAISWPLRLAPTWGSLKVPVGPIAAASVPSGPAGKWRELLVWATRLSGGSGAKIPIFGRRLIEVCCGFFEPGSGSRRGRRHERGCSGREAQAREDAPRNCRLGDGGHHPHRFSALTSEGFDTEYSLE